ncbi:MAG: bifunctional precorrin-2 dehydrogenase/sirohydrochlorin ferrochelatase [Acidobacteriaceae bacterium]
MSLLPIFLRLDRRRCLVVGAGAVALGKIESLQSAGGDVIVVAPDALPAIRDLAQQTSLSWRQRAFQPADLDNVFLVIAATNSPHVNHAVYQEALQRNIPCNAVDDPPNCDFYFGSVISRDSLQIAISTAGESPAFAQQLKREIDTQLPQDLGPWLAELGSLRREVLAALPSGEGRNHLLQSLAQRSVCGLAECPARRLAQQHIQSEKIV